MVENVNASGLYAEQAGDDGKQGALARAVEAEQSREAPRRNREADVVERPAGTVAVADTFDRQRHPFMVGGAVKAGCLVLSDGWFGLHHGFAIVIPQGSSPT